MRSFFTEFEARVTEKPFKIVDGRYEVSNEDWPSVESPAVVQVPALSRAKTCLARFH